MRTILLLLALLSLTTVHAQGKIYRWVDESGRVQYTDKAPESSTVKSEEVKVTRPPPTSTGPRPSWQEQEREVDRRLAQKHDEARSGPSSTQLCAAARRKMAEINAAYGHRVFRVNERGERVYMEDSERTAIQNGAAQEIAAYCPQ